MTIVTLALLPEPRYGTGHTVLIQVDSQPVQEVEQYIEDNSGCSCFALLKSLHRAGAIDFRPTDEAIAALNEE